MSPSQVPSTDVVDQSSSQKRTKSDAASTVLNITELAERIFLELPIGDLLIRVPSVSKHWKAVIDSSPGLQQALFFAPITTETKDVIANPFFMATRTIERAAMMRLWRTDASWRRMLPVQPPDGEHDRVASPYVAAFRRVSGEYWVVHGFSLHGAISYRADISAVEGGKYLRASTSSLAKDIIAGNIEEWQKETSDILIDSDSGDERDE